MEIRRRKKRQRESNDRIGRKSNAQIHHLFHLIRSNINTENITFLATTNFVWFLLLAFVWLMRTVLIVLYSMDYLTGWCTLYKYKPLSASLPVSFENDHNDNDDKKKRRKKYGRIVPSACVQQNGFGCVRALMCLCAFVGCWLRHFHAIKIIISIFPSHIF